MLRKAILRSANWRIRVLLRMLSKSLFRERYAIVVLVIGALAVGLTGCKVKVNTQSGLSDPARKVAGYSGEVLAGNSSPYLVFNKADYEKAIAEGKIIFLDFFANWCPICRSESPEIKAGFDGLIRSDVVGFMVNYNDSETDSNEKELAKQFGITYQHTKVVLRDGKEVLKSLDSWDRQTFDREFAKII